MNTHEQFESDLPLYAFDTLQGEDRVALEAHLENCPACRRELEALRGDLAMLALSAPPQVPSAKARQRLMVAVAKEPRRAPSPKPRPLWGFVPVFTAAALALVALFLWHEDTRLSQHVAELAQNNSQQEQELRRSGELLATLNDPGAARFTLSAAKMPPQPQGKAIYARDRRSLPALPPQQAYELWLIPVSGAPIPSGMFKPDARGSATVINPPLPAGVEAKTFAVTVEPEAGSTAPTSQPIMVGTGG
jgi:anti-sigma-K factor RskA